ncbi:hypothetical protein CH375_00150 [Leptospira ellisii]|nr:hypothetical protein CH375_00150 [Leptospira ellisii]
MQGLVRKRGFFTQDNLPTISRLALTTERKRARNGAVLAWELIQKGNTTAEFSRARMRPKTFAVVPAFFPFTAGFPSQENRIFAENLRNTGGLCPI